MEFRSQRRVPLIHPKNYGDGYGHFLVLLR
jgi:hypothetical protein